VTDQAVDVLELLLAHFGARHFPESGMALRTSLREDFSPGVLRDADPRRDRVGAEVVDGVHFSEGLAFGVDDRWGLSGPLVVLGMEKGLRLVLVAPETGLRAFVVLEVLPVGVVGCNRRHCDQGEQRQ